jgi:hypothetical protein
VGGGAEARPTHVRLLATTRNDGGRTLLAPPPEPVASRSTEPAAEHQVQLRAAEPKASEFTVIKAARQLQRLGPAVVGRRPA